MRGSLTIANQFSDFTDGTLSVPYVSHQVMHASSPKAGNVKPRENCRIVDVPLCAETRIAEVEDVSADEKGTF